MNARNSARLRRFLWVIPAAGLLVLWWVVPPALDVPTYKVPTPQSVVRVLLDMTADGRLIDAIAASLGRLLLSAVIGTTLGAAVGLAMATNAAVLRYLEPLVTFFQAIAGIAWIPIAILWFGLGSGPVIFVVTNAVFFIVLYNTLQGVQRIPSRLYDAGRVLGATRWQLLWEVSIPGAMVSVLAGTRSGLAFGWRALIGAELIVASSGIGFLSLQGARDFRGDIVIACIPVIGVIWMLMDRVLTSIERRTVQRWGMLRAMGAS
jgi:ABC-type nitrate/sulfonate/bicarbonate transport system permease component